MPRGARQADVEQLRGVGSRPARLALPGSYTVKLTVSGKSQTAPFAIYNDPVAGTLRVPSLPCMRDHLSTLAIHQRDPAWLAVR